VRFNSLDELVEYLFTNKIMISNVEFSVDETPETQCVTPDVIEEPPAEELDVEPQGKLVETISLVFATGLIHGVLDAEGFLLVDDFTMTPNACGVGSVIIEGRKLFVNMCETNGETVAYLHTDKSTKDAIKVRRKN
jgi:hypothetical protein